MKVIITGREGFIGRALSIALQKRGITKHFAEVYARIYLPSATGARLHNVYGPNPRQGSLLWCLMNQDLVTIYDR